MMQDQNPETPRLSDQSSESTRRLTRAEASRINGARSRGPKTEEGKRRSSRNAVTHGLTCSITPQPTELIDDSTTIVSGKNESGKQDHGAASFLLSNEDSSVYNNIRAICITGLKPSDEFEWELVGEIAITRFLTRRIYSTEARLFDRAMYEDAEEFGKEQRLYGAAESERLAAALEHASSVQKLAGLMRRYDTQISRKFHSLLDQLRRYRADKRRYSAEFQPGPDQDVHPDDSGGGNINPAVPHKGKDENDNSDEHGCARAAQPAVPGAIARTWTAGNSTAVVAVSWSAGTCTSLPNGFVARQSRSQRTVTSERIAASPTSEELPNESGKASVNLLAEQKRAATSIRHSNCRRSSLSGCYSKTKRARAIQTGPGFVRNEPEISRACDNADSGSRTSSLIFNLEVYRGALTAPAKYGLGAQRNLAISGPHRNRQTTMTAPGGVAPPECRAPTHSNFNVHLIRHGTPQSEMDSTACS